MLFLRPTNIFISVLVDTIILGFLFILTLGTCPTPGLHTVHGSSFCSPVAMASLPNVWMSRLRQDGG